MISIAVTPSFPKEVDILDKDAVNAFLKERTKPLVEAGFQVEVQYGAFDSLSEDDGPEDDDLEEERP